MRVLRFWVCTVATGLSVWAADDPFVGTWMLSISKTSMLNLQPLGPLLKSQIKKYDLLDDGLKVTTETVTSNDTVVKREIVLPNYGEWPVPAQPDITLSLKRIGNYTLEVYAHREGEVASISRRVVSRDGKTMIQMDTLFIADSGLPMSDNPVLGWVFEKQASNSPPPPAPTAPTESAARLRVGGDVLSANLVTKVPPRYPPLAKQAGIQGTVRLAVVIGKDGAVLSVLVIAGHPLLTRAAIDAVQQWVYRPTLRNGQPVEVAGQVEVDFALSQ